MKRRTTLLAVAALALIGAAIAIGLIAGRDDGTGEADATTRALTEAVPSLDVPAAASPSEQTAVENEIVGGLTQEGLLEALRRPSVLAPEDFAPAPGAAVPAPLPGGASQTVEATDPEPRSSAGVIARRCVQPRKVPALAGHPYQRDCWRGSYGAFPAKVIGVLNYCLKDRDCYSGPHTDEWYVCTATVAGTEIGGDPGNESVLATAGHCLGKSKNGRWSAYTRAFWLPSPKVEAMAKRRFSDQEFRRWIKANAWWPRLYAGTQTPVGWMPGAWQTGAGWDYDFAAMVMAPRRGVTIQDRLGGLGVDMNGAGAGKSVVSYGYPAGNPFDGTRLFLCRAQASLGDTVTRGGTPTVLGIGCDMTGGSSGGPWGRATDRVIISVNSYVPKGPPRSVENMMFGPHLDGRHWPAFVAAARDSV
jgi:hypothetical protein